MRLKLIFFSLMITVILVFMSTAVNAEIIEGSYATTTWQFDTETGALTVQGTGMLFDSWVEYKNDIKSVVISEGITTIYENQFSNYDNLISVVLPKSLEYVGENAFRKCDKLESVTFLDSPATISDYAFAECPSMTTIDLGNGIISIGESAIGGKIESICIPASVKNIGYGRYGVFSSWSMTAIIVDEANTEYSSDEYGVLFNKDKTVLIQYPIGSTRTEYTVPYGVETIAKNAFIYVKNLTSVKVPDTLTSIEGSDLLINFTFLCNVGSYAESYARENGIKFLPLTVLESDETVEVESEEATTEEMTETQTAEKDNNVDSSEVSENRFMEIVRKIGGFELTQGIPNIILWGIAAGLFVVMLIIILASSKSKKK